MGCDGASHDCLLAFLSGGPRAPRLAPETLRCWTAAALAAGLAELAMAFRMATWTEAGFRRSPSTTSAPCLRSSFFSIG